jgi:hypothetical protein
MGYTSSYLILKGHTSKRTDLRGLRAFLRAIGHFRGRTARKNGGRAFECQPPRRHRGPPTTSQRRERSVLPKNNGSETADITCNVRGKNIWCGMRGMERGCACSALDNEEMRSSNLPGSLMDCVRYCVVFPLRPRNRFTHVHTVAVFFNSHCQITRASQPSLVRASMFFVSRALFRRSFGNQKLRFVLGMSPVLHACECQKHPCTNITLRRAGKTKSGFPGRSRRCSRKR